jgi:hypothetical protein
MKFNIAVFFESLSRKLKLHFNLIIITGTVREDLRTFMIISRWSLHEMRNVSYKLVKNIRTHTFNSVAPPPTPPHNRAVYEIMWKMWYSRTDRPQMIISYGACALHTGYGRLHTHTHTHTLRICNRYCFLTAIMFVRRCLSVTLALKMLLVQTTAVYTESLQLLWITTVTLNLKCCQVKKRALSFYYNVRLMHLITSCSHIKPTTIGYTKF